MANNDLLRLHPADNVAIARRALGAGTLLELESGEAVAVINDVPAGHKVAIAAVGAGEPVWRYGQVIGLATRDIAPGEHVHVHNLGTDEFERAAATAAAPAFPLAGDEARTFAGYRRADGRTGTRNYVSVVSTVNCSAHVARQIAAHFTPERLAPFPNVDGVAAFTHGFGCTFPAGSRDEQMLARALAGMACHPNSGGYLLVGHGCEKMAVDELAGYLTGCDRPGSSLVVQDAGGTGPAVEAGIAQVEGLLVEANRARRTPQPLSELVVALQCGGSDAWSGVTANPALGLVVDEVVRSGGSGLLAETPEIVGAEHLLLARAAGPAVARALEDKVAWWRHWARRTGFEIDQNRSPGNEAGGLTTIYEKSLGAVSKGGSTPLVAVYDFAQRVEAKGLSFMDTPGYDPVSVTGQVAGGCNLVIFTTGRGSVWGSKPAPVIKVCTNSETYRHVRGDMDMDAGRVLAGATLEEVAGELLDLVVAVASGEPTKSETHGVGETEFVVWNLGATL
ncbi:MAG TPA: altronate dehydratase family protein [Anaerolineae bacterium]|nr:altronate dehydratase family protein [Anaerolineae bacterium]